MKFSKLPLSGLLRTEMLPLLAGLGLISNGETARAATIGIGDVTASLGPTFFVDDAVIGGTDTTVPQTSGTSYDRTFAGLLNTNQGPTRVTFTGFGFATSGTTAGSLTVTFTYLGADEALNGGDDVAMGSATGTFTSAVAGEYVFAFDTPITANLMITGRKFRIQVAPTGSSLVLKNAALPFENGATGTKFSVAGIATSQRLNLAKYQAVTTDSVSISVKGQRLASYVTDGVAGNDNSWESSSTGPHWAQVTFPFPVAVGSAQVFSGVDDGGAMTDFKLQYLDNVTWLDVPGASVTGNTNVERNLVFTNTVTASAFRIYNSVDATIRIRELALYPPNGVSGYALGTDLTLNLAQQRPALATTNTAGNFALLAVDGRVNRDSKWQTSTAGAQSLEIDLRVSTKIGSAHLYSGSSSPSVLPLAAFVLRYWDGTAWQAIPGGTVTGNTSAARAISFTGGVTTTKVRLEFTNSGTNSVQELCIFPANNGNTGYPLGAGVIGAPTSKAKFDDYNDAFYNITNPTASRFIAVDNTGAPGLSQPGLTIEQGQYQVLLNNGTGTYRLRNRATGECLSGAQLSTTPGALLVDSPYSALPDQDWILESIDATNFYLMNQWSGLVIDTQGGVTAAGTPLVQNTNTGALSQRWRMVASAKFPKKGSGGTSFGTAFDVSWAYNWGQRDFNTLPADAVFHPMQWGNFNWDINTSAGPLWQYNSAWRTKGDALHLLGYNEPDAFSQGGDSLDTGNMNGEVDFSSTRSMAKAVEFWPRLLSMDLPLVSPAPASGDGVWLGSFYTEAARLGYRVDYTAVHTYPGPSGGSATNLLNDLESAYTTWDRPVWLTEFSFVNWNGTGTWTEEDNYNCLAEFLWRAESRTWLRKYALFRFKADTENPIPDKPWSAVGPRSNSHDANNAITPFGELYAAWDGDATVRAGKTYCIHNRATRKRLANTLVSNPIASSIRVNDASVEWTLVQKPSSSLYYITSTRDGRRLSFVNGGAVNFVAAGTTGTAVEWDLTENQFGWFYLGHPATSKRLQLAFNNNNASETGAYTMAANTVTGDALSWRFIVTPPHTSWKGTSGTSWTTAGNWTTGTVPATESAVLFDSSSTANLATVLNQDFDLWGITVTNPTGPVSIGGAHSLSIGVSGLDLSSATQNLTITAPLALSTFQSWNIASGRTLSLGGLLPGTFDISVVGAGKVSFGASSVFPDGVGAGNLILETTLNLNGTSQSFNGLSGSGIVENLAAGAAILTVGNNNVTSTFNGTLQETAGTLALVKTGTGGLTLMSNNTHSGGTTNNGTGGIFPKTDTSFGTGPVVMNEGTLYATGNAYTFANALTLNDATLRVGGGAGSSIDWTGPVNVTGDSGIAADGSTSGVTISGTMAINGSVFTSYGNNVQNDLNGIVSGTGTISVTGGFLNFAAANTFSGTLRATAGQLKLTDANGFRFATLDMNAADAGSVNLSNKWATIGALAGSRNLNLGSNSNVEISIGNNNLSTTYSGVLNNSGSANRLKKIGTGTLTLSGPNTYNSETRVLAGTLALGANNVLPGTAVMIGDATLDASTFTDTVGTLDVTSLTSKINLGTDAALAFADSSAVVWTGGKLNLTGTFVPGVSLRFGTDANGLTATQLGLISAPGFGPFTLSPTGYLTAATAVEGYDSWKTQITNGQNGRTQDADGDGFTNIQEFLFGTSPIAPNGSLVKNTTGGGNLVLRWLQRENGATYALKQTATLAAGSWVPLVSPVPALDGNQTGVPIDYDFYTVTLPIGGGKLFFRIEGVEN